MDFHALSAQLVRARRGARTQKQLSRALGFQSNVLFAWENGRDTPTARLFFELAARSGPSIDLEPFLRGNECPDLTTREGVAAFLRALMEGRKLTDVGAQMGRDRHAVGRWLRGQTEISLPDLLAFVEYTTLSVLDFVSAFVDPQVLPEAKESYDLLEAAREAARQKPWTNAIVHMVELPAYKNLKKHQRGWFASRLGISIQDEDECLTLLVKMGQIRQEKGIYAQTRSINVDTRRDPAATRQLASFWMKQGAERVLSPGNGRFSFNTFAVSEADFSKIKELQSEYFRKLRALVADSSPIETVAVATFQLFPLSVSEEDKERSETV